MGWCTYGSMPFNCFLFLCVQPVKEVVREKVMEFLKSRSSTPFTLSSLSASGGEVMSAVWECVSMRERERDGEEGSVSKGEVAGELNALVKSLPKSGVVVHVPVNSTALKLEVHYEVHLHRLLCSALLCSSALTGYAIISLYSCFQRRSICFQ